LWLQESSAYPNKSIKSIPATHSEELEFYNWLEEERPDLLSFRVMHGQDKWQVVQAWLSGK